MSWLFNPTRSEITSLDSGNIDDILSEYFESSFFLPCTVYRLLCIQSLICDNIAMLLHEYVHPRSENMNCNLHRGFSADS